MRWLAIVLMLCGVGINQSFFLASVVEMIWETGTLFPASSIAQPRHSPVLPDGQREDDQSAFAPSAPAI
jgi:hypothetical protein